jgi:hypothetical protein
MSKRKSSSDSDGDYEQVEVFDLARDQGFAQQTVYPDPEVRKKQNISSELSKILADYFQRNGTSEADRANIMTGMFEETNNILKTFAVHEEELTDGQKADMLLAALEQDVANARATSSQIWETAFDENKGMARELPPEKLLEFVVQQRELIEKIWADTRVTMPTRDELLYKTRMSRLIYDQIYKALMDMLETIGDRIDENKFNLIIATLALLSCSGIALYAIVATAMTGIINNELKRPGLIAEEPVTLSDFFRSNLETLFTCSYNLAAGVGSMVCRPIYNVAVTVSDTTNKVVFDAVTKSFTKSFAIGSTLMRSLFEAVENNCFPDTQSSGESVASEASASVHDSLQQNLDPQALQIPVLRILDAQLLAMSAPSSPRSDISSRYSTASEGYSSSIELGGRRGRKSRRHKKRKSTLKRRRMKRRRTRKGKKRRHTRKH